MESFFFIAQLDFTMFFLFAFFVFERGEDDRVFFLWEPWKLGKVHAAALVNFWGSELYLKLDLQVSCHRDDFKRIVDG